MKKIVSLFTLKKEAWLFDSRLYILKTFLSVLTAYAIASFSPDLLKKDMISLLFGLILTLEPVTITGIRSGLDQIYATALGALSTAVIITLFGINIWTVALAIAVTLFVCLRINWKIVSVVALFTSIYMTQYVQLDAAGMPSTFLTFRLRIIALTTGVAVAILYNFIFSLFSYRRMEEKRIAYILHAISGHLGNIRKGLSEKSVDIIMAEKNNLPHTFNDIDWTFSLLSDKEKEYSFKKKLHLPSKLVYNASLKRIVGGLRNINHLVYDMSYQLLSQETLESDTAMLKLMDQSLHLIQSFAFYFEHDKDVNGITVDLNQKLVDTCEEHGVMDHRIIHNISMIYDNLSTIHEEISTF